MRTRFPGAIRLVSLLAIAACSDSQAPGPSASARAEVRTDRAAYAPGDAATASIRNVGDAVIGYAPCPITVQQRLGSS